VTLISFILLLYFKIPDLLYAHENCRREALSCDIFNTEEIIILDTILLNEGVSSVLQVLFVNSWTNYLINVAEHHDLAFRVMQSHKSTLDFEALKRT
jgi:hypothetical protein